MSQLLSHGQIPQFQLLSQLFLWLDTNTFERATLYSVDEDGAKDKHEAVRSLLLDSVGGRRVRGCGRGQQVGCDQLQSNADSVVVVLQWPEIEAAQQKCCVEPGGPANKDVTARKTKLSLEGCNWPHVFRFKRV